MEWKYKDTIIRIDQQTGNFGFILKDKVYITDSLTSAKRTIDELLKEYYTFTQKDMDKLLSKLDNREQELVKSLYHELHYHKDNSCCEVGIVQEEWKWEWDFSE